MITRRYRRSSCWRAVAAAPAALRRRRPNSSPTIRRKCRRRSPRASRWSCMSMRPGACSAISRRPYLDGLKDDPDYKSIAFFRVDYDNQKDVVAKLDCPRSTRDRLQGRQGGLAHVVGHNEERGGRRAEGGDLSPILALPLAFAAGAPDDPEPLHPAARADRGRRRRARTTREARSPSPSGSR